MKVAIVGAGVAGLAAGRTLAKAGLAPVLFEKSRGPGGRVATRRVGPYSFDTGATSIAPRGLAIERVMLEELDQSDLVKVEKPIYAHTNLRAHPGDPSRQAVARYAYRQGNNQLAKLLSEGLDIRLNTTVDNLRRIDGMFEVEGEPFQWVVLTPPIPQAGLLLWSLGESRAIANTRYRSCLAIMLGFDKPLPDLPYHALIDVDQRHPMTWVSVETAKCPERAPAGHSALVLQMSPQYSWDHYQDEDEAVLRDVIPWVVQLFGEEFRNPVAIDTKRWKYSQPELTAMFDSANRDNNGVLLAGDGLSAGRVERAYESGVEAAKMIIEAKK